MPREERKVVSVLFADLVGFTTRAEQMDPEEVRAVLQPYHAALRRDLERFGGTVEKFIGDAVMAVFGAPVAHEDDPERAVRAALAIRDRIVAEGRLHVRIGITTGEALVTLDARAEAGEGMVAGDVVNTASRLQGVAPVDAIVVDEPTYRATTRSIEYRDGHAVVVRGKSEPLQVREVVSARSRFGVDVRQAGGTELVGRVREIELLVGALQRAISDREPQLVTIVGVPGIGKSRMVWELFDHIEGGSDLVSWRQGRSLPYAEGVSFWAFGEIVKAETGILETDAPDEAARKLAESIAALDLERSDAEWIDRHLRPLVGLEASAELHGDHRGEAFTAWRQFLEALAEHRPLVVVFEDLHWADEGLLDLIDHLADWTTGVPLLIVATTRPDLLTRRPGWGGGRPNAFSISLGPLSDAEAARLVAALVERVDLPVRLREAVIDRAQGNPLYAEEFARLFAERGHLEDLPGSVQGIIAARLDGLVREEKELLQDAAVLGKVFWSGALSEMRGRERAGVEQALHGLERKEFIRRARRSSVAGETEYAFRHILVRDVAYAQIPRAERGDRHARAAGWMESLGRAADHAELLAGHYLAAIELSRAAGRQVEGYAERARSALRSAGDRALSLNAFAAAANHYRAALELMPVDDPDRPLVLFGYGKALRTSAEAGEEALAEAEASLRATGRLDLAAEAAVLQAELTWYAGDGETTAAHLGRATELVKDQPLSASKAYVLSDLSRFAMLAARSDDAIRLGREAVAIAEPLGLDEIRAHALNNIGTARVAAGDPAGIDDVLLAVEIGEAAKSPDVARAMNNLHVSYDIIGDKRRGTAYVRTAYARARELGNVPLERFTRAVLATIGYAEGTWDEALRTLDDFIAEAETGRGYTLDSEHRVYRARIRFARSDVDGALEDAEHGLAAARRIGDPQTVLPALGCSAWLMVQTGRDVDADPRLDEALGLARNAPQITPTELVMALVRRGRRADIAPIVEAIAPTRWRDLLMAITVGDSVKAADIAEVAGILPTCALLRLAAAEQLLGQGRVDEARSCLESARGFWRSVGATRYLAEAERIAASVGEAAVDAPRQSRGRRQTTRPRSARSARR
jgi:class 3 adenylate cyclase/tetratricopeptide (TPR) repeat protein